MHMGIPVCKWAGIAKKFAYGDPITHNEIVHIRGLTLGHASILKWVVGSLGYHGVASTDK